MKTDTEKRGELLADALSGYGTKVEDIKLPEYVYKGGPAFPKGGSPNSKCGIQTGMTLRDYFAGQALIGLLSNKKLLLEMRSGDTIRFDTVSENCGYMADAMIMERNKC